MLMTKRSRSNHLCPLVTDADSRCTGPMCPAWRWHDPVSPQMFVPYGFEEGAHPEPAERPEDVPAHWPWAIGDDEDGSPSGWLEPEEEAEARRNGYCGMAGPVRFP